MRVGQVAARRLLLAGSLFAVGLLVWQPIDHDDTYIYEATGRWVLDHRAVPRVDPFSWTFSGRPWQSNGWAWGVVLWLSHEVGGQALAAGLKPLLVVAAGVATVWASRTFGTRQVPAFVSAPVALVLITPWITDRPQLVSFVLFPLTLGVAHLANRRGGWGGWWLLATGVLFAAWVNLHSVALFGVMAIGALEAGAVLDRIRRERPRQVASVVELLLGPALLVVVAFGATLVNPWGFGLYRHSAEVRRLSAATISEWYPLVRSGAVAIIPVAVAVAVVAVIVVAGRGRRSAELILPLALTAGLTVDAIRNAPFFVLGAAVLALPMLPRWSPAVARRRDLVVVGVLAALVITLILAVPRAARSGDTGPNIADAATAALPAGCQLRNDYRLGGYALWARSDVLVSADGRNDLYGLEGYEQNAWFEDPDEAVRAPADFRAEGTDCVLATPDSPVVAALVGDGWRVVGRDRTGVALAR
jgi:hypothetical protein